MAAVEQESYTQSAFAEVDFATPDRVVYLEHHRPNPTPDPYHFHPSIEVNFLRDCDMTYSFSGQEVLVKEKHFCVFWAANPHRSIKVSGEGVITNAYISLSEFLKWPLPAEFSSAVLSGSVLSSRNSLLGDVEMVQRWENELDRPEDKWQRLHSLELQSRLFRLAIDGWDVLLESRNQAPAAIVSGTTIVQLERMLAYVGNYYANPIKVKDVAEEGGVSATHAVKVFRKMLGRTVKEHINDMRLFHARMLLTETDLKILAIAINTGFVSLSAFYQAFHNQTGQTPAAYRKGAGRS